MPAYDLANPADHVRLALDQPNRWRRQAVANMIGRRYGWDARAELVRALQEVAKERAA